MGPVLQSLNRFESEAATAADVSSMGRRDELSPSEPFHEHVDAVYGRNLLQRFFALFEPGGVDHIDVDDLLLVAFTGLQDQKKLGRLISGDWLYFYRTHDGCMSKQSDVKIASTIATHIWRKDNQSLPKPVFDEMVSAVGKKAEIIDIRDKILAFFHAADLTLPDTEFKRRLMNLKNPSVRRRRFQRASASSVDLQ